MAKTKTKTTKDGLVRVKRGIFRDTKTGHYRFRFEHGGIDYEKVIGPYLEAAELALQEAKQEIMINKLAGQGFETFEKVRRGKKKTKFSIAAQDYLREHPEFKPSTIAAYESILKFHLSEFADTAVQDITAERLRKFQAKLQVIPSAKGNKTLSPRRVNSIMQFLRTVLKQQFRDGEIHSDVASQVKRVSEQRANVDPLSQKELVLALDALDPHYRPFFTTQALTGARPNELMALRWNDIDWHSEYMLISKGRVRGKEGPPKTKAGERRVPLNPEVLRLLRELKNKEIESIDGYVFTKPSGQPLNKHMDKIWSRAMKKAGLRPRCSYQLRHTFATHALEMGVPMNRLAQILGHTTIEPLVRNYSGVIQDHIKRDDEKVKGLFSKLDDKSRDKFRESKQQTS